MPASSAPASSATSAACPTARPDRGRWCGRPRRRNPRTAARGTPRFHPAAPRSSARRAPGACPDRRKRSGRRSRRAGAGESSQSPPGPGRPTPWQRQFPPGRDRRLARISQEDSGGHGPDCTPGSGNWMTFGPRTSPRPQVRPHTWHCQSPADGPAVISISRPPQLRSQQSASWPWQAAHRIAGPTNRASGTRTDTSHSRHRSRSVMRPLATAPN